MRGVWGFGMVELDVSGAVLFTVAGFYIALNSLIGACMTKKYILNTSWYGIGIAANDRSHVAKVLLLEQVENVKLGPIYRSLQYLTNDHFIFFKNYNSTLSSCVEFSSECP
jgi:hypothetical protein